MASLKGTAHLHTFIHPFTQQLTPYVMIDDDRASYIRTVVDLRVRHRRCKQIAFWHVLPCSISVVQWFIVSLCLYRLRRVPKPLFLLFPTADIYVRASKATTAGAHPKINNNLSSHGGGSQKRRIRCCPRYSWQRAKMLYSPDPVRACMSIARHDVYRRRSRAPINMCRRYSPVAGSQKVFRFTFVRVLINQKT